MDAPGVFLTCRTLLVTPGNRPDRLAKGLERCADGLLIDLEDAVPPDEKSAAREAADAFVAGLAPRPGRPVVGLRLNAIDTAEGIADLAAVSGGLPPVDFVALPKVEAARDVEIVRALHPTVPLMAIVETARGIDDVTAIAAVVGRGGALGFGGADYCQQLGVPLTWEATAEARARVVRAAARADLAAFDVPSLAIGRPDAVAAEARAARALGFTGKLAIHPEQIGPILDAFTPDDAEIRRARAIVDGYEGADGRAVRVEGRMIDVPVYRSARKVLARAGAFAPPSSPEPPE